MAVTAQVDMDGCRKPQLSTCSPDVYTVRVHARVRAIRMYGSIDV